MIEDIDKKQNNPINNSSVEQKNVVKSNSSREKNKNDNINANMSTNNPQQAENFGTVNKDYRTNLSTNQNFASNNPNQYNTNSNFMRANN